MNKQDGSLKNQSGVVLVISLIMLLLLTLIGVMGMQTTTLEEKMSGNMRDQNLAFQAAESALTAVEKSLDLPPLPSFVAGGTGGFYSSSPSVNLSSSLLTAASFWTTNPVATSTLSGVSGLGNGITAPRYIIQKLVSAKTYRITVRATGGTTNSVVVLQSVYVTP